jgi:hypothetical protein
LVKKQTASAYRETATSASGKACTRAPAACLEYKNRAGRDVLMKDNTRTAALLFLFFFLSSCYFFLLFLLFFSFFSFFSILPRTSDRRSVFFKPRGGEVGDLTRCVRAEDAVPIGHYHCNMITRTFLLVFQLKTSTSEAGVCGGRGVIFVQMCDTSVGDVPFVYQV